MSTFFDTTHCKSKMHCLKCRAKTEGRLWREKVMLAFDDVLEPDFACPLGQPWDMPKPKPKIRMAADGKVYRDGRRCLSCEEKRRQRGGQK